MDQSAISLQKHCPELGQFRFYAISVQPNLFGSYSLIREWGRIGSRGRVRIDVYQAEADAVTCMQRKLREKKRRGYR